MYCVVEFDGQDANQTAVVRTEWWTPKKMEVFWPPYKISSQFNKSLSEGSIPNEETWKLFPVKRCLYFSDDLLKARQKEKEAEKDSDLQTDADEGSIIKKRKKKPVMLSSSSDEDVNEEPTSRKKSKFTGNTPSKRFLYPTFAGDSSDTPIQEATGIATSSASSPQSQCTVNVTPVSSFSPIQKEIVSNSGFSVVANKLAKLELEVASIKQYLEDFLPRLLKDAATENEVAQNDSLPPLPCNEKTDIDQLEDWLIDANNQDRLVKNFGRIGGRTAEYLVKKILERVFTKNLALQYNWTGKHQKFPLKGLKILDVIFSVVQKNRPTAEVTECDVILKIRNWFRFAKDRDGGREERRNNNK